MGTPTRIGVRTLHKLHRDREPIVVLTAYDATLARLADECGVHMLLVGDSLGMTMLGYDNTIPVTLDQSLHHTAAVVRGASRAMVVGDMPFLTCQVSPEQALTNAARYLQEAGAQGVKLEGGSAMAATIERLTGAGIPVLGHIGILPQSVLAAGGYRVHGRSEAEAGKLRQDARDVQAAGAFAVVLEGLPRQLAAEITDDLAIPTIGIGAGAGCSGQVQVVHDILGLFEAFVPKHTRRYATLADEIRSAITSWCRDVRERTFPSDDESFE